MAVTKKILRNQITKVEGLINDYTYLFNEYFIEAIEDFTPKQSNGVRRVRRVKRVPRVQSEAK